MSAEVMARTIGAATNDGWLGKGRHWGGDKPFGIPTFDGATHAGNALVYWDSGTDTAPLTNTPAVNRPGVAGHDPHEDPRATYLARVQKSLFLQPGSVVSDVCGAPRASAATASTPSGRTSHRPLNGCLAPRRCIFVVWSPRTACRHQTAKISAARTAAISGRRSAAAYPTGPSTRSR